MSKEYLFPSLMSDHDTKIETEEGIKKLAKQAAEFLKSTNGDLLETVHLKGSGMGYYWSPTNKKLLLVPRRADYYVLPLKKDDMGRNYLFLPHFLTSGIIICVDPDEIQHLGFN
tara:strand:+ start:101 stop:442 length:342 start_codon:yes stop_codon:yes gene_type:complete